MMKLLDEFYEDILEPIVYRWLEITASILEFTITVALFITIPLWIIPYKIWKHKGGEG